MTQMPSLQQRELSDVLAGLAEIETLVPSSLKESDLLLCSLGFEPRCLSVPAALAAAGHRCRTSAVLEYETNKADNEKNWPSLSASLSQIGPPGSRIPEGSGDYVEAFRDLIQSASLEEGCTPRVVLDISVMANRIILPLMKILVEEDVNLSIVY